MQGTDSLDFKKALAFDLDAEGRVYENVPNDSGGPTKWGITWIDGNIYRKSVGLAPLTIQQAADSRLAYLTPAIIAGIYYGMYWVPMRGADLPSPVGQVVFDCAVNTGAKQSVKFLQRSLGIPDDGVLGSGTVGATKVYCAAHGAPALCRSLIARRQSFYTDLAARVPKDRGFLAGWLNRCQNLLRNIGLS